MSPYLTFKIISIVVMLAILLVVVATKKSGKKQKQEALDNKPEPPKMDEYQLRRTTLYRLEYKLIPFYIESIQKNKGDIKNLYDIAAWERGIEAWLQASRYIDWEEIACEILGALSRSLKICRTEKTRNHVALITCQAWIGTAVRGYKIADEDEVI